MISSSSRGEFRRDSALDRLKSGTPLRAAGFATGFLFATILVVWNLGRLLVGLVLALAEPLVRAILVPAASLTFFVTVFFGFVVGDPRFPRCGMLGLSVALLLLYWLFVWVTVLVQGGGRGRG